MLLPEDHRAEQDTLRSFVQAEIAPHAAEWDKTHHFPRAQLKGLAQLGCYGVAVPSEWDGAGLDYLALAVILEEIAAGDGATSTVVSVNNCPVCSILMTYGNADQKVRFLKPLARGDGSLLQAFGTGYQWLRTAAGLRVLLATAFEEDLQEMKHHAAA